ncbi:permease [Gottschalkiaceae bacterium SANA]|nr:permease [Gottschalkiaceae bacterium SANA]
MDPFTLAMWVITLVLFFIALLKDQEKTLQSMKKSKGMMGNMLGSIISIILLIGLVLTLIPPETIEKALGSSNQVLSSIIAAVAGSITLIPAFVAFPLVGSLVDAGASIVPGVAFLTTLTMVGVVTFPLEKQEFGTKFAITRNGISFIFALVIAIGMGVLL